MSRASLMSCLEHFWQMFLAMKMSFFPRQAAGCVTFFGEMLLHSFLEFHEGMERRERFAT